MKILKMKCIYCKWEEKCEHKENFIKATNSIEQHAKQIGESNDKRMSLRVSIDCGRYASKPDPNYSYCDGAN